jgi:predicted N-acetyltransferase YhbS
MKPPTSLIRMAQPDDDAALCRIFEETPLRGSFDIALERNPSYFTSQSLALQHDVFVGVRDGAIIGCGARIVREAWWQGEAQRVAYLGDLRCHPSMQRRAGWLIREGYQTLATVQEKTPAAVTWSAIFEENAIARRMVSKGVTGMPEYIDRGRLLCPILLVPRRAKVRLPDGFSLEVGNDAEEIGEFLQTQWQHRPLAPVLREDDFLRKMMGDFLVLRRSGELIGVVALWDVRAEKQVRMIAARGWLARLRRPLNLVARGMGWPELPEDGDILPMAYLSFLAVKQDDAGLAEILIRAARVDAARRGIHFLCACAHETHPFASILQRFLAIPSHGRLYQVAMGGVKVDWPNEAPQIEPALL